MASGRLKALLHAQQAYATRNATAQQPVLLVAPPGACNTQQQSDADRAADLRRLVGAVACANPTYWTPSDIEEAVAVGMGDLDDALMTFRALAVQYGAVTH